MSRQPHDLAFRQDLRIASDGLEPGMFVSELDRPWLGSGFPFEGVLLSSPDEVQRLQKLCRWVRVDIDRGRSPSTRFVLLDDGPAPSPVTPASGPARSLLKRIFAREAAAAETAHGALEASVREVMQGLRHGAKLDAEKLRAGVDTMLDSINRHPGAMPWVMEMRRKGDYIYQHGLACSIWAAAFGRHLGYDRADLQDLALGALLCDVGKIRLSGELLERTGPLTGDELGRLRSHVGESLLILAETSGLSPIVHDIVHHHHERHDGSGYPDGLRGQDIPMFARIAGLVDSYDAMISHRSYAPSRSPHQAVMELYEARDRLFQAELVEQFIRTCGVYPTGTLVELSDGSVGVVMAVNTLKRLRPTVMLLLDAGKAPMDKFRLVDLADAAAGPDGEPLSVRGGLPQGAYGIDRASLFLD